MIIATDRWHRGVKSVLGNTVVRPLHPTTLDPEIEEALIHKGYAIAFDPTLKDDAIVEETEEPIKTTKRTAKK